MADGISCKHCGLQETSHLYPHVAEHELSAKALRALRKCPGFEPDDPELAAELEQEHQRRVIGNAMMASGMSPKGK